MKVLYLLNRVQKERIKQITRGQENDNHLYGMLRLRRRGIRTDYYELEQFLPVRLASFIREYILNIYWVHLPFIGKFFSYDIIFTATAFGAQLMLALYPFKKPKWIMLDFGIVGLLGEGRTLKQKIFHFIVSRASGIVTIDEYEKHELQKRFPELRAQITCMRFAVDTKVFQPHAVPVKQYTIFSPGRDPGRDFATLFTAITELDVQLTITARSYNIQKLLPLPEWVHNVDLSADELLNQFASAHIVVIPLDTSSAVNNAMGCSTLVEAMAMGKAIIATRTNTMESYIIDGVNGLLVPPHNPRAMQKAIVRLLSDDALRNKLGANARDFAVEYCDAEIFADSLASYFKNNMMK